MNTFVILRRNGWSNQQELEKAASRSARVAHIEMPDRVRWLRSYLVTEADQRLGTVCIYQAVDASAIQEHARRAELPCDTVIPVSDTVVINPDPIIAR